MNKIYKNSFEAIEDIKDGSTLMFGGFGLTGIPENSVKAICELGVQNLTCISNEVGLEDAGIGLLAKKKQIKKIICSYLGNNKKFEQMMLKNLLKVELTPQGTLAEQCRAGGAGIPAFFTPTGCHTEVAVGKEVRYFNNKPHILQHSLTADFALVKAWKGDRFGNLIYKGSSINFNPIMAMAGKITIAEVEEFVEPGELEPNQIHTPGIFVQRIYQGESYEKKIEYKTTRPR